MAISFNQQELEIVGRFCVKTESAHVLTKKGNKMPAERMSDQMIQANKIVDYLSEAKALGVKHAKNAASWCVDGNFDINERERVLMLMRDGDSEAYEYLPREPNLRGEFADDPIPLSIFRDIVGRSPDYDVEDDFNLMEYLADAYEEGVSETFSLACEKELIKYCERS